MPPGDKGEVIFPIVIPVGLVGEKVVVVFMRCRKSVEVCIFWKRLCPSLLM